MPINDTKKLTRNIFLTILIALLIIFGILNIIKYQSEKNEEAMQKNKIDNMLNSLNDNNSNDTLVVELSSENSMEESESKNIEQFNESMLSSSSSNEKEKEDKNKEKAADKYYIKVNNQCNVVTIYTKDSNGNYTVPKKAMLCSIGTSTPASGVYKTQDKAPWCALVGGVWGQYHTRIVGSILFHSVPYEKKDKSKLEWWEYDKLGTKASKGCVRLTVQDAKWIYDNCALGTQVEFYSSANPGPLGKPTAKKISAYEEVRGWDPTDPDSKNPWNTYNENKNQSQSAQETVALAQEKSSSQENTNSNQENVNSSINTTDNTLSENISSNLEVTNSTEEQNKESKIEDPKSNSSVSMEESKNE